jgi:uncharacterized membrane protein
MLLHGVDVGWQGKEGNPTPREEPMHHRQYAGITALIFTIVAIGHAARLYYGWPVTIGPTEIPMAVSWVAVFVTGLLAIAGFTTARS